ncbi:MAG TPA: hypothetical protein DCE42_11870 [Myxococcales bacterium]|mgnify:CR=1 FL=1|nr:hypothetical protein [Deltaproteobacteria bacterium]MBU48926.1 hypothetical protein [Deltaproteobacteria bacterium]HAA55448.1 hypothetical protein [Myxococcales bacterium]|tara:strand:- start:23839 stop:26316 length:2478 start_codon:yes stop_codon:yes gene_type:complete
MADDPQEMFRIRVSARDGVARNANVLKGQIAPHIDFVDTGNGIEFELYAIKEKHFNKIHAKLESAKLEIIEGVSKVLSNKKTQTKTTPPNEEKHMSTKPYSFVSLPDKFDCSAPLWHDGTNNKDTLSGEIRCELTTLTPLLVGWEQQKIIDDADSKNHTKENEKWKCREQQKIDDADSPWPVPYECVVGKELDNVIDKAARQEHPDAKESKKQRRVERARVDYKKRVRSKVINCKIKDVGKTIDSKSILSPLRAPWDRKRPVILPGDSLKGLLRHELGALLGAPMERVAERSYSYRPNALFAEESEDRYLLARLARVPEDGYELEPLEPNGPSVRVPKKLELLSGHLTFSKKHTKRANHYCFDKTRGKPYKGGIGAGEQLNAKCQLYRGVIANDRSTPKTVNVPETVQEGYLATIRHLADITHGHFSERHPDVPKTVKKDEAREHILEAAKNTVFSPGDLVWVEWDTKKECITSLGWHYYYRWAYTDTVRWKSGTDERRERRGLFPQPKELEKDENGAPKALSAVRHLFGYTGDNEGCKNIGEPKEEDHPQPSENSSKNPMPRKDHTQLMGRISVNSALEIVGESDTEEDRFLPPTFLKELGMPRPSAVEHYLKQPYNPKKRPSDQATLVTYGDVTGYDAPGELAGRKFYLDRKDAENAEDEPWEDHSEANRLNDRSTLALEASKKNRTFRFTIRFRDLKASELAAIMIALCPNQFSDILEGTHKKGYCSKLGYARPLGWGSVCIETKQLLTYRPSEKKPTLESVSDVETWTKDNYQTTEKQEEWLAIHRRHHPDAGDYPRGKDKNIHSYHTKLRAEHSRKRRYK